MTPREAIASPTLPRESNVLPFQRRGADGTHTAATPAVADIPGEATASASTGSANRAAQRRKAWLRECAVIALIYALSGSCLSLYALTGTVHWSVGLAYAVPGWVSSLIAAALIGNNLTTQLKDPSLSLLHTVTAMAVCLAGIALYPPISFVYVLFMFAVFLSATYRMPKWQANTAWVVVSLLVAALTMGLGRTLQIPHATPAEQFVSWLCLTVMLGRCVLLSLINMSNTVLLRQRSKQMAETLAQIERLANYDELTSVLNRRSLLRILKDEQERTDRTGSPTSVAILDLDRFKALNDTHGHLAGDQALRLFAASVQELTRNTDRFGRYGGEEFLMILTDTDVQKAEVAVERIRAGLDKVDWSAVAPNFKLTFSAGVASYRGGESAEQLLIRADSGLYDAKNAGRNCTRAG